MSSGREYRNIALLGFMGAGKTCVGRLVANKLQFQFIDTDHLIETRAGKPIPAIFAQEGEDAFRALERQIVEELKNLSHTVISTGGGIGANPELLASLQNACAVLFTFGLHRKLFGKGFKVSKIVPCSNALIHKPKSKSFLQSANPFTNKRMY